jgi:putative transport protein
MGLQLGPGFIAALRQQGLKLNLLAVAIVLGGAMAATIGATILGIDFATALGIFSGATRNTPSLGAAQGAGDRLRDAVIMNARCQSRVGPWS